MSFLWASPVGIASFSSLFGFQSLRSKDGEIVGIQFDASEGSALVPNVGDYVHIDNSADGGERSSFSGKVRSRLFTYIRTPVDMYCHVNIVVEKNDDDWGLLIKE